MGFTPAETQRRERGRINLPDSILRMPTEPKWIITVTPTFDKAQGRVREGILKRFLGGFAPLRESIFN